MKPDPTPHLGRKVAAQVVAVVVRPNDAEDKLIGVPPGVEWTLGAAPLCRVVSGAFFRQRPDSRR